MSYPYHEIQQEPGEGAMKYRVRVIRAAREYGKTHSIVGPDGTPIVNPGCEIELTVAEIERGGGGDKGRRLAALARQPQDRKDYATRMTERGLGRWLGDSRFEYQSDEDKAAKLAQIDEGLAEARAEKS